MRAERWLRATRVLKPETITEGEVNYQLQCTLWSSDRNFITLLFPNSASGRIYYWDLLLGCTRSFYFFSYLNSYLSFCHILRVSL